MTDLRTAAANALEALLRYQTKRQDFDRFADEIHDLSAALEQPAEPLSCNDANTCVNETNAILAGRYFDLLKVVEAYEKNGVTCQTFRHFVDSPCAECNCTTPPANEALIDQMLEAANQVSDLIKHQYTGTREGMTALQIACDATEAAIAAARKHKGLT